MMKKRCLLILFFVVFTTILTRVVIVQANTSENVAGTIILHPLNFGNSGGLQSTSTNYDMDFQQLGDFNTSNSDNSAGNDTFDLLSGYLYAQGGDVYLSFKFLPSNRYLDAGNNYQSEVTIEVRPVGGDIDSILFSEVVTTDANGEYTSLLLTSVTPGTYDVTAKGWATLRLMESSEVLSGGSNTVDFSQSDTLYGLAGDLDAVNEGGRGGSDELGDNYIGAADFSDVVANYDNTPGPAEDRRDLDQYGSNANAADVSIVISNYAQTGD